MAQKNLLKKVLAFVAWLTGVIVALAVGIALTEGSMLIIEPTLSTVAGWLVVIATIISVVLVIIHSLKK